MTFSELWGSSANYLTLVPLFYADLFQKRQNESQIMLGECYLCKSQNIGNRNRCKRRVAKVDYMDFGFWEL